MKTQRLANKIWAVGLLAWVVCASAAAQTNIDPNATGNQYGYGENVGWANLQADPQDATGVRAQPNGLLGFAWFENIGWVNFGSGSPPYGQTGPADFGVNHDGDGNLSGFAYGENVGWIAFNTLPGGSQVTINTSTGKFTGYAWGENIGWVSFADVNTNDVAQVPLNVVPVELSAFSLE